ncbi:hypothetical protein KIPB_010121 [Kipferlia bialata]|uniref:Uncharacterized protein n=1 Tax=Kipferlia bialata TaxID=797122 RepID=A0A9K3D633_9EUKA|nr:hypothetical protein KIPB_010121 [Kipferlia bialata]|eukprot:g10121.t1
MAAGQIRVIGTQQHLKSRFGAGYRLHVSHSPCRASDLDALVQHHIPRGRLKSRQTIPASRDQQSVYSLPLRSPLSGLLSSLVAEKNGPTAVDREGERDGEGERPAPESRMVKEYHLAFSSLEEVFLRVAHRVEPPDNDVEYSFE